MPTLSMLNHSPLQARAEACEGQGGQSERGFGLVLKYSRVLHVEGGSLITPGLGETERDQIGSLQSSFYLIIFHFGRGGKCHHTREFYTDKTSLKTSLKADREDWGVGRGKRHRWSSGAGPNGTGGPAAPREPTKSLKSFQNQRKA